MADYRQIAVWNERKLKEKNDVSRIEKEKYRVLLSNAIILIEEKLNYDMEDIITELGLCKNEYNEIMGETL